MTVTEALGRLHADAGDAEAWEELDRAVEQGGRTSRVVDRFRDEAIQDVKDRLREKFAAGIMARPESPEAYVARMVANRSIDLWRREQRERKGRPEPKAHRPEEPGVEIPIDAWRILDRVFQKARTRRDAWQREHLDAAWRQVKELATTPATLIDLLVRDEGLDPTDPESVQKARWRAYTAHRRLRAALLEALAILKRDPATMDPEEVRLARDCLELLKRRRAGSAPPLSG